MIREGEAKKIPQKTPQAAQKNLTQIKGKKGNTIKGNLEKLNKNGGRKIEGKKRE